MRNVPFSLSDLMWLLSFPILMSVGQMIFRFIGGRTAGMPIRSVVGVLFTLPAFYVAAAIYGFSILLWVWLLGKYPLSLAYPFAALALVLVPMLEMLVYKQPLTVTYWIGVLIIASGVVLIVTSQRTA